MSLTVLTAASQRGLGIVSAASSPVTASPVAAKSRAATVSGLTFGESGVATLRTKMAAKVSQIAVYEAPPPVSSADLDAARKRVAAAKSQMAQMAENRNEMDGLRSEVMALQGEIAGLEVSIADQKRAAAEADDNFVEEFGDWLFGNEPAGPDPAMVAQLHALMAKLEQVKERLQHVAEDQKHLSNGIESNLAKAGQLDKLLDGRRLGDASKLLDQLYKQAVIRENVGTAAVWRNELISKTAVVR